MYYILLCRDFTHIMKLKNHSNIVCVWILAFPFVFIAMLGFVWQFVWSQMVGNVWSIKLNNVEYSFKRFWRYKQ